VPWPVVKPPAADPGAEWARMQVAARLGATQSTTKAGLTPDTPAPLCDQAGPAPADTTHRPRTPPVAVPTGTRYSPRGAVPARGADGVARHLGRGQPASRARSDMCRARCGLPARLCRPHQRARPGLQPVEFPNPQQVAPGTEVGQADLHPVVGPSARHAAVSTGHPRRADPLPGEAGSIKHDRPAERARTGVKPQSASGNRDSIWLPVVQGGTLASVTGHSQTQSNTPHLIGGRPKNFPTAQYRQHQVDPTRRSVPQIVIKEPKPSSVTTVRSGDLCRVLDRLSNGRLQGHLADCAQPASERIGSGAKEMVFLKFR